MALVDLKSDLTWYGTPPSVNYLSDKESGATGFTDSVTATQYIGVANDSYTYPVTVRGGRLMQPKSAAKFPGPQNFLSDSNSGAKGFTLNMDKLPRPDKSEFLGIQRDTYTYPVTVKGSRLMQPKESVKFPGPQNFINNRDSGARGFTLNMDKLPRNEKSEFLGIYNSTYSYPNSVLGGRLMQPAGTSNSGPIVRFRGPQNFFDNRESGARGFTIDMDKLPRNEKSEFLGIDGETYKYPATVRGNRLMKPEGTRRSGPIIRFPGPQNFFDDNLSGAKGFTLDMGPIKGLKSPLSEYSQFIGIRGLTYTYPASLGEGKGNRLMQPRGTLASGIIQAFPGPQNFFADVNATGFTENMWKPGQSKKPSQFVGINGDTYTYPSNLVDKFNDLNIVDDSYNTTYIQQPYVVRGLQRKGEANSKPQYWGFGSKSGFDDGFIRGGAVTVADRVVADTKRIAKFLASPKGLLWSIKQFGLGLTNPKVETISGSTRTHFGVTSLLSVAGNPFGLHFTRHGIPWLNRVDDYSNVQLLKERTWDSAVGGNRLINLKNLLFNYVSAEIPPIPFLGIKGGTLTINKTLSQTGLPITTLSALGGAQSVYGIGITDITRRIDSGLESLRRSSTFRFNPSYNIKRQYASKLSSKFISSKSDDKDQPSGDELVRDNVIIGAVGGVPSDGATFPEYTKRTPGNDRKADISTSNAKDVEYGARKSVNDYITLAYNKIPKKSGDRTSTLGDFRNLLDADNIGFTGKRIDSDYIQNSLESQYGFGDLGKVGADRTDIYSFGKNSKGEQLTGTNYKNGANPLLENDNGFRGDKVNAINIQSLGQNDDPYEKTGTKDLIKFFFEDGNKGNDVMIFRAILTGLTDSFSPGWEKIDIMGRPDGAYIYTSYERTVSFNFTVAAMSRGEMIPIWRKLNHLSTYTMPNLTTSNSSTGRISGPFMRMTLGDMYSRVPGFISSLSYTVPDESSWDIAEQKIGKQLPMVVEVAVSYTIVGDTRPQLRGKAYSMNDWLQN